MDRINRKIIKDARKFAEDLCNNLDKFNKQQDGSCYICGANPNIFVDYLAKTLQESDDRWHAKIRSLIPKIGGNARRLLESLLDNPK